MWWRRIWSGTRPPTGARATGSEGQVNKGLDISSAEAAFRPVYAVGAGHSEADPDVFLFYQTLSNT